MQQRVIIAMALATDPALLILDEPTTGLDATVEAEVLDLVAGLQAELQTSVLFISHNLGVIAKMCDRVGVLYAGRLVEEGETETVLRRPAAPVHRRPAPLHPARRHAQGSRPARHDPRLPPEPRRAAARLRLRGRGARSWRRSATIEEPPLYDAGGTHVSRCHFHERAQTLPRVQAADLALPRVDRDVAPLLAFEDLGKVFKQQGHDVQALVGVSTAIWPGETLGLVGESGSGKTTLARTLLGILEPTTGAVTLDGQGALSAPSAAGRREELRALQIVFQNPDSALNRRHQVRRILRRSLKKLAGLTGRPAEQRLLELMQSVRLAERYISARPSQLSGGLKQRVAIARAFAGEPRSSSSATSRPPRSTSPSRPRSSTCSSSCRRSGGSPTSSSRTTSASSGTSPTGSPSSTSGG